MASQYIIVEHGMPYVVDSLPNHKSTTRFAVMARTWENVHAFDESSHFRLIVDDPPSLTFWQRTLVCIYNPAVTLEHRWKKLGEYSKQAVIELVAEGLQHDDDIIQQWFGADDVLALLNSAATWDELVTAVRCVEGRHEVDVELRKYVETVLPHYYE